MSYYLVLSRLMLKSKAWLWFSFIYKILIKEIIIIPKQLVLKRIKCNNTTGVTTLVQLKEHLLPCKTTKDYEGQSVILGEQSVTLGNQLAILGDTLSDCCPARFLSQLQDSPMLPSEIKYQWCLISMSSNTVTFPVTQIIIYS